MLANVWGVWKQNIGANMIAKESYMMSYAAKWLDDTEVLYNETRTEDDTALCIDLYELLNEADLVIAHNGDKFDLPKINAYAIKAGLTPPSPYKTIDTLRIARKNFFFQRNTLGYLADYLELPSRKLEHEKFKGFELWAECMKGNEEAWAEMKKYNIEDVHVLEELYFRLRPFMPNHPTVTMEGNYACPKCGSVHTRRRGYTYTNAGKYRRYRCDDCSSWSQERYTTLKKDEGRLK